jgi:hypothetical protein
MTQNAKHVQESDDGRGTRGRGAEGMGQGAETTVKVKYDGRWLGGHRDNEEVAHDLAAKVLMRCRLTLRRQGQCILQKQHKTSLHPIMQADCKHFACRQR